MKQLCYQCTSWLVELVEGVLPRLVLAEQHRKESRVRQQGIPNETELHGAATRNTSLEESLNLTALHCTILTITILTILNCTVQQHQFRGKSPSYCNETELTLLHLGNS